jgi:hypothetical protein
MEEAGASTPLTTTIWLRTMNVEVRTPLPSKRRVNCTIRRFDSLPLRRRIRPEIVEKLDKSYEELFLPFSAQR